MILKTLGTKKFNSRVVKETIYGVLDNYGMVENTMTLKRLNDHLFIEWEVGKDAEIDYAEIGIFTCGKDVTEYDGVFELPKQAIELLKECGFNTEEIEGDE